MQSHAKVHFWSIYDLLQPSTQELLNKAILASVAARREWDLKPVADRAQIFFKAADVISGPKRAEVLAKTMIGQVVLHPSEAEQ